MKEYLYEYQYQNIDLSPSHTRFVRLCSEWNIKVNDPLSILDRVIEACPDSKLDPYYESVHIFAWFLKLKAENRDRNIWRYQPNSRFDFSHSLLSWWRNTRRAEGMELASKNQPYFQQALDWFKAQEAAEKAEKPSADFWHEAKKDKSSAAYMYLSPIQNEYNGPDLSDRMNSLLDAIEYKKAEWPESIDRMISLWDRDLIPADLAEYIKANCFGLSSPISILQAGGEVEEIFRSGIKRTIKAPFQTDENSRPKEAQPITIVEEEEDFDPTGLQKVKVRLENSRIPRIGYILSESDANAVVRLNGPLQNGDTVVTISNDRITKVKSAEKKNQPSPELQAQLDRIINDYRQRISTT